MLISIIYLFFTTLFLTLFISSYHFLEYWSVLDSIYFVISTVTFVGGVNVFPKYYSSKILTIFLIFASKIILIGIFNYFFFIIAHNLLQTNIITTHIDERYKNGSLNHRYLISVFYSFVIITSVVVIGMCVFSLSEGWILLDSLYFSVVTCSSVGYGDLIPISIFGKLFACFYMIFGNIIFILFVSLPGNYHSSINWQKNIK